MDKTPIAPPPLGFIDKYLQFTGATECPTFFHRWTAISLLGAQLGRDIYFRNGHFTIHPNMYIMLIGAPGTKKSSAIKVGAKLLKSAGYKTFGAKKTRQEKFLIDLQEQSDRMAGQGTLEGGLHPDLLEQNLFGSIEMDPEAFYAARPPAECYVAADEFNNFIGTNNLDFMSILGELWDFDGVFDYRLKSSDSVYINCPTINILGGNTSTGFSLAFPSDVIGQGFFSRLLLVHAIPTGERITFIEPPCAELEVELVEILQVIKETVKGEVTLTPDARKAIDTIYTQWDERLDIRFESYYNRRFNHLMKLCMIIAAADGSTIIDKAVVTEAHTLLAFTEHLMPKALGEFGKGKFSSVANAVMNLVDKAPLGISRQEIWKQVSKDLDKLADLMDIMSNLLTSKKIQYLAETEKFMPVKHALEEDEEKFYLNWDLLTEQELNLL